MVSPAYSDIDTRKKRGITIVKYALGISYYIFMSVMGYRILKDSSLMPSWLGGNGDCS